MYFRELPETTQSPAGATPPRAPLLAWFAGADRRILADYPTEWTFYSSIGALVLANVVAGGIAMTFAFGFVLHEDPASIWFVGVLWAAIVVCIERVVLQIPTDDKRWLPLAVAWRFLFSLLLAILLAVPLELKFYEPEINDQLAATMAAQTTQAEDLAHAQYDDVIDGATAANEQLVEGRQELKAKVRDSQLKAACEGDPPCTPIPGCSAVCRSYQREAHHARQELRTTRDADRAAAKANEAEIAKSNRRLQRSIKRSREAVRSRDGLAARETALAQVTTEEQVWVPRVFLILFDLLALVATVTKLLGTEGGGPYEMARRAQQGRERRGPRRQQLQNDVEQRADEKQAQADEDVNNAQIDAETDERLGAIYGGARVSGPRRKDAGSTPVPRMSLGAFTQRMQRHRDQWVEIGPQLRRGGFIATSSLGVFLATSFIWSSLRDIPIRGGWLTLTIFGLALGLMAYTRGFRRAPAWGLGAVFALLVAGVVLPIGVLLTLL